MARVSSPGDQVRVITLSSIPEPATLFLVGSMLALLARLTRRFRRHN
jgi:hypothetical protein